MRKLAMNDKDYGVLARMLQKADLFASFTVGQLDLVLPYILLYSYDKGEAVFRQGDPGDALFIVYEGAVQVKIKKGFFSFSRPVSTMGPGNFFGEMALLSKQPRNATVVAVEPAKLFALLTTDFEYLCKQTPAFAAEMDRIAARRKFISAHGE